MKIQKVFIVGLLIAIVLNATLQFALAGLQDALQGYPVDYRFSTIYSIVTRSTLIMVIMYSTLNWLEIKSKFAEFMIGSVVSAILFVIIVYFFVIVKQLNFVTGPLFLLVSLRVGIATMVTISSAHAINTKIKSSTKNAI